MRNLSDHDIDQLFRNASVQTQPEFDPADWALMARRLDTQRWWLLAGKWFGGSAVVAVLVISFWMAYRYDSPEALAQNDVPSQLRNLTDTNQELVVSPSPDSFRDDSGESRTPAAIASHAVNQLRTSVIGIDQSSAGRLPVEQKRAVEVVVPAQVETAPGFVLETPRAQANDVDASIMHDSSNEGAPVKTLGAPSISEAGQASTSKNIQDANDIGPPAGTIAFQSSEGQLNGVADFRNENAMTVHQKRSNEAVTNEIVSEDSLAVIVKLNKEEDSANKQEKSDSTESKSSFARMAARLKASPDFSSENFDGFGKTGFNYGVEVEYFLSEHVSLSAGLIRSRKYYGVQDAEYFDFVGLDIDGDCAMWDNPVNVNYYVTPSRRYSLFASAGFSSYLMSKENYQFEVTTPGYEGPETNQYSQQVKNENQEWFRMLNVSIGVQRRINRNFALQVEPFVKIPLAEVGAGNVSLSSFGTYLSLRYNFLFVER